MHPNIALTNVHDIASKLWHRNAIQNASNCCKTDTRRTTNIAHENTSKNASELFEKINATENRR